MPRRRKSPSKDRQAAEAALARAEQAYAQALARRERAKEVGDRIREERRTNQFADILRRALR